jgi:4-amino-4-deoxy-L-arabinose transferase-like glycosyltransferase
VAERETSGARAVTNEGSFFEKHGLVFVIAFAALLYVPWLAAEPVHRVLEANRLVASREMFRSGDWVLPTLNGEPYVAKPPLQYWLVSLASLPFGGVTVEVARAVSALATIALAVLTFVFVRREIGKREAVLAACALVATGLFVEKGARAELETLLAFFTAAAILAVFRAVWSDRPLVRRAAWILASGLALGAAILVKGPVAPLVVVVALVGLAIGARERRGRVIVAGVCMLVIAVVVALPWILALHARANSDTQLATIRMEIFQRLLHPGPGNKEAFWFYLVRGLPGGLAPATALLPGLWILARTRTEDARRRSLLAMLWAWSVGVLVVMSCSPAKEVRYLIATYPAWTMLAATAWLGVRERWFDAYKRVVVAIASVLTWIAPLAVVGLGWKIAPQATTWIVIAAALLLLARIGAVLGLRTGNSALVAFSILVGVLGVRTFLAQVRFAEVAAVYPFERMGAEIAARMGPEEPLVFVGDYDSSFHWAVDRRLLVVANAGGIAGALDSENGSPLARFVVARETNLPAGSEPARLREISSWTVDEHRWRLLATTSR